MSHFSCAVKSKTILETKEMCVLLQSLFSAIAFKNIRSLLHRKERSFCGFFLLQQFFAETEKSFCTENKGNNFVKVKDLCVEGVHAPLMTGL